MFAEVLGGTRHGRRRAHQVRSVGGPRGQILVDDHLLRPDGKRAGPQPRGRDGIGHDKRPLDPGQADVVLQGRVGDVHAVGDQADREPLGKLSARWMMLSWRCIISGQPLPRWVNIESPASMAARS